MVKCFTHGLRGFDGAVQRRLATLTVTMLISSYWQLSSEVELRRIFDVCKRWANSGSHEFVMKNMVRYMRPHGRFAYCSCKNAALTLDPACRPRPRVHAAFLHLQYANRPFWPHVSKYTISSTWRLKKEWTLPRFWRQVFKKLLYEAARGSKPEFKIPKKKITDNIIFFKLFCTII